MKDYEPSSIMKQIFLLLLTGLPVLLVTSYPMQYLSRYRQDILNLNYKLPIYWINNNDAPILMIIIIFVNFISQISRVIYQFYRDQDAIILNSFILFNEIIIFAYPLVEIGHDLFSNIGEFPLQLYHTTYFWILWLSVITSIIMKFDSNKEIFIQSLQLIKIPLLFTMVTYIYNIQLFFWFGSEIFHFSQQSSEILNGLLYTLSLIPATILLLKNPGLDLNKITTTLEWVSFWIVVLVLEFIGNFVFYTSWILSDLFNNLNENYMITFSNVFLFTWILFMYHSIQLIRNY